MGFRILLVSVVAGLGFSLPTGKQMTNWHQSACNWADSRVADWNAPVLEQGDALVVAPEPEAAPASAPVLVVSPEAVLAPEALPVVALPVSAEPTPVVVAAPAAVASDLVNRETVEEFEDFDFGFGVEFLPLPELSLEKVVNLDAAFADAQGDFITSFVAEQASNLAASMVAAAPQIEEKPISENMDAAFAAAQEDFVIVFVAEKAKSNPISEPAPELVKNTDDNLYEGLAHELNRKADGLDDPKSETGRTELIGEVKTPDRAGRLTNAVRLTRDAVYAWANLLHGPAVVTIGR